MPEPDSISEHTNERWISVKEACEHLGVKRHTILRWIELKDMPAVRMGKFWRFKVSELDEWVRNGGANE